jgi:DNA-binding CsgD family transcriptional regulator
MRHTGGMALLTLRERDVVRLAAEGMRNQEISLQLHLSEHTVRNYLLRIFDKLGIGSRVELVLYAFSGVEGSTAPLSSSADSARAMTQRHLPTLLNTALSSRYTATAARVLKYRVRPKNHFSRPRAQNDSL